MPDGSRPIRVLLVEDSPSDAALLEASLRGVGPECCPVARAETIGRAVDIGRQQPFDVVLLDLTLPDCRGVETVVRARKAWPETAIVVLTGAQDEATGLEAVRHGAQDFLVKGKAEGYLIVRALRYAVERQRTETMDRRMNAELEQRVLERTAQLRRLALEITLVEQRERRRIAALLHDNLQQQLVFSHLSLGSIRMAAGDPDHQARLERVEQALAEAIEIARDLAAELSPPLLYSHGLAAAVRWFAGRLRGMTGLEVTLLAEEGVEPEAEGHRVLLFQAIREALTNIVKHAGAAEAVVRISRSDGEGIEITISDEGRGFDPGEACGPGGAGGLGLLGVRERLHQMGGRCEVRSEAGRGTVVTLSLPASSAAGGPAAQDGLRPPETGVVGAG